MNDKEFGKFGEQMAEEMLLKKGYKIVERNWRYKHLEVDLIAYKAPYLVFVEVKTRKNKLFGYPEHFVDALKQRCLIRAAGQYLFQNKYHGQVRFDVVSIIHNKIEKEVVHFEDAFFPRKG